MSIHNICFCGEIRKIFCGYTLLSVAMAHSSSLSTDRSKAAYLLRFFVHSSGDGFICNVRIVFYCSLSPLLQVCRKGFAA